MKVAYDNLPCVHLKRNNKEYDLYMQYYDEVCDEIRIRTSIRETELCRGWIGDLFYKTANGFDIVSCEKAECTEAYNGYTDVLLANIQIYSAEPGEPIIWEYRFLKK